MAWLGRQKIVALGSETMTGLPGKEEGKAKAFPVQGLAYANTQRVEV